MTSIKYPRDIANESEESGVEGGEDFQHTEPFDPASISISSKVVALDTVLRRIRNSTIRLSPDFQRNYVWNEERKSLLIESLMLRIPLPMFYVSEDREGRWEVVDGLQRLTTIKEFILGPLGDGRGFPLKKLEFWGEQFNGKTFLDISKKPSASRVLNNLMEAELSFTIINPDTPENVKRNIFKRINTGGMRLSMQEIRHALYQGKATALLNNLAKSPTYLRHIGKTIKDDRMAGRELILRYISFESRDWRGFKGNMDDFLSNTMRFINSDIELSDARRIDPENIQEKFDKALVRNYKIFGTHAFRRSQPGQKRTPINKSLFDVWMFCFSRLREENFQTISNNKEKFLGKYYQLMDDETFSNSIGKHGSDARGVSVRYKKIIELLKDSTRA